MSATIPVLYHLVLKGKNDFSKKEYVNLIAQYYDSDGYLGFCSTSISFPHKKVGKLQTNLMSMGVSLYMLTLF
ncbi:hypothetical protein Fisuc_2673 [Fibrobacter succinogenes subsp. succinogenes S85]|uniref:Uncharacterized protein n=1 Tax=Fibrobacter succinogenes (strain ATCC 19169 / S85) TaxID=59374 RepID=A0ABN3Z102_FIBSS|nr:hypothetical protein [Fibrobacter succinogenes]ACX76256.1 hypothetical protein Fisuc_2673 [Fibrobacter succinogenes subsp. succinogenes S85]